MFGYITPMSPELKVRDFETYKAVYCGLCHRLGELYGFAARFVLNYDFTFMALVYMSMSEQNDTFGCKRCVSSPAVKKKFCEENDYLTYCADSAILMAYYKLIDTIRDSGPVKKITASLTYPLMWYLKKKAQGRNPQLHGLISQFSKDQRELEQKNPVTVDEACEPTARVISSLASHFSSDEGEQRILCRFGYMLGRLIYLFDAIEDYGSDEKSGSFNPFLRSPDYAGCGSDEMKKRWEGILNLTIGELISSYHLLNIIKYKDILDNYIFLGLKNTQQAVLSGRKDNKNGRSL